jgi:hypothetical protein
VALDCEAEPRDHLSFGRRFLWCVHPGLTLAEPQISVHLTVFGILPDLSN